MGRKDSKLRGLFGRKIEFKVIEASPEDFPTANSVLKA